MIHKMSVETSSRLRCPLEHSGEKLFFSLVDYRNNYFTNNDPEKIIEFYGGFENRNQLIQWMKERPKGVNYIHEVEGDKNIIVVIPTADFNGKYATECRKNIFKGLHIVFVESGGRSDFYFNSAHNVNVGVKKAMEYGPKWIVFSGDDMYKIDDISILVSELMSLDHKKYKTVFTEPSKYHSIPCKLSKPRLTRNLLFMLLGKDRWMQLKLEKKFGVQYFLPPKNGYWRLFFGKGISMISIADFGIFSSEFINGGGLFFDEVYINSADDMDLSLRVNKLHDFKVIKFKIGDYMGSTLGTDARRHLMEIAGLSYFNSIVEKDFINKF
ncbi:MAG: hypothetical protein M1393_06865 [Candidatus Thermoplasmatota archaeon]|nr:hypothetical protein [Candidatus Thermoplasmatota archaeon]